MFEPDDSHEWTEFHQKVHSLLWSTFLNITSDYDSDKFRDRYEPVHATETFRRLQVHTTSRRAPRLRPAFEKVAAWTLAPRFSGSDHPDAPTFRAAYRELFGVELAAEPSGGLNRPPLPALPELGIEDVSIRIETSPPAVRARLEAVVQIPFHSLRDVVCPGNWASCAFWSDLPEPLPVPPEGLRGRLEVAVRLPGGELVEDVKTKARPILLDVDIAASAFAARIDYAGVESAAVARAADRASGEEGRQLVEIEAVNGFLLVEKLAGRPGACRVAAEREARFGDFNHQHFAAQTVTYWLVSELLSFCEFARRPQDEEPAPK